jgi:hypothetical protein
LNILLIPIIKNPLPFPFLFMTISSLFTHHFFFCLNCRGEEKKKLKLNNIVNVNMSVAMRTTCGCNICRRPITKPGNSNSVNSDNSGHGYRKLLFYWEGERQARGFKSCGR